jgi:hypothetical protein
VFPVMYEHNLYTKYKSILITGRGGLQRGEVSRKTHFLYSVLTDGGEAVSLTHRQRFTPRKIPGTHSC